MGLRTKWIVLTWYSEGSRESIKLSLPALCFLDELDEGGDLRLRGFCDPANFLIRVETVHIFGDIYFLEPAIKNPAAGKVLFKFSAVVKRDLVSQCSTVGYFIVIPVHNRSCYIPVQHQFYIKMVLDRA